jgi:hypothetical protein
MHPEDRAMMFPAFRQSRLHVRNRRPSPRPRLEALEDRWLPSTFTVLNLNSAGTGSLRQAVLDANAHAGADVVRFAPGLSGTVALAGSEIAISDDLTINGPGAGRISVSGGNVSRVFRISGATTDVEIDGLTITNGAATGTTVSTLGGPVTLGGGILNDAAHLTLSGVNVANNQASGFIAAGGGIANIHGATLSASSGTITANKVTGTSIDSPGGAIFADAGSSLAVDHCSFSGNQAIDGGAIAAWGGSNATVSQCDFEANVVRGDDGAAGQQGTPADNGGAIFVTDQSLVGSAAGSVLNVDHCSFSGNEAHGSNGGAGGAGVAGGDGGQAQGGAVSVAGVPTVASIAYCDFSNNLAQGGSGGKGGSGADGGDGGPGSGAAVSMNDGTLTVSFSSFTDNAGTGGVGGTGGTGGSGGAGGPGRGGALVHTVTFGTSTPHSTLSDITMRGNVTTGGRGGVGGIGGNGGVGGDAQGGAIRALLGTVNLYHGLLQDNQAVGGIGGQSGAGGVGGGGGTGLGGGFFAALGVKAYLEDTSLMHNLALGGAGAAGGDGGDGLGGGLFLAGSSPFGTPEVTLHHCLVQLNSADGGAAGAGGSGGSGLGGGVFDAGILHVEAGTHVTGNDASTAGADMFP